MRKRRATHAYTGGGLIAACFCLAAAIARGETVRYEVTFDATWSNATHPGAFPLGGHFSPLVGATHNASVVFWEPGGMATTGIQNMAELGATAAMQTEINAAIAGGTADSVITGSASASPGSVKATFDVSSQFSLVTLVTMVAPSPDWFVGVHGLPLFQGGAWQNDVVVQLFAYDAGTDSGLSFTAANAPTAPHVPIALITGSPFAGSGSLGTFTFHIVPEPSGMLLLSVGAAGCALLGRYRKRRLQLSA